MSNDNSIQGEFTSINGNSFKPGDTVINIGLPGPFAHATSKLAGTVVAFNPTDPNFDGKPSVDVMFVDGTFATVANAALRRV